MTRPPFDPRSTDGHTFGVVCGRYSIDGLMHLDRVVGSVVGLPIDDHLV